MSRPLFRIPLAKPAYLGREAEYVADAVARRELSHGDYVERFEAACAAYLKVKHAVAVANGTVGLHLAGIVAGWNSLWPNSVLTSPLTYVASANAIRYCNAKPDFADVDPTTWTLGYTRVGEDIETGGILLVDLYGMPGAQVVDVSNHGLPAVYDACEAFGATIFGEPLTRRGGLHVFSFYANKILTTGEGGLVTTDDDDQARQLRLLRGQGQHPTRRYYHEVVGYNARMTNLQGALGLAQVEQVEEHLRLRRRIENWYSDALWQVPVETQKAPEGVVPAPWLWAMTVRSEAVRDRLMAALTDAGVESRPVFPCLHQMPAHATQESFPVAEDLSRRGIVLPLYAEMTEGEVGEVCDVVKDEVGR